MNTTSWNTFEEFLTTNQLEFTHVETEEEYLNEMNSYKVNLENVKKIVEGDKSVELCCKRWMPATKRVCRWVRYRNRRQYECTTISYMKCIERC